MGGLSLLVMWLYIAVNAMHVDHMEQILTKPGNFGKKEIKDEMNYERTC
jgi:hypothetical protein